MLRSIAAVFSLVLAAQLLAEKPAPITLCELSKNLRAYDRKVVTVVDNYVDSSSGPVIEEEGCTTSAVLEGITFRPLLSIHTPSSIASQCRETPPAFQLDPDCWKRFNQRRKKIARVRCTGEIRLREKYLQDGIVEGTGVSRVVQLIAGYGSGELGCLGNSAAALVVQEIQIEQPLSPALK